MAQRSFYDNGIIDEILGEVKAQKVNSFPDHCVAQASMVSIPCGNLVNYASVFKYHRSETKEGQAQQIEDMRRAAIEVCAQAIRFMEHLPKI